MLETTCTICGDDFDPEPAVEVDSTNLCPCCVTADSLRRPHSIILQARPR